MRVSLFLTCLFLSIIVHGQSLVLEGTYQGKDLYVQNPFKDSGDGFCVSEVLLNGKTTSDTIASSAFVIRLSHLKIGQKCTIEIFHGPNCKPKVLNPDPHAQNAKLQIYNLKLEEKP